MTLRLIRTGGLAVVTLGVLIAGAAAGNEPPTDPKKKKTPPTKTTPAPAPAPAPAPVTTTRPATPPPPAPTPPPFRANTLPPSVTATPVSTGGVVYTPNFQVTNP